MKILKIGFIIILTTLFNPVLFSQTASKIQLKPIGSLSISVDTKESLYMNFGGPSIRFEHKKFGFAYGMFPSVRFFHGDLSDNTNPYRAKSAATPILGTGISVNYKKFIVVVPMYYLPANNVWLASVGFGFKM